MEATRVTVPATTWRRHPLALNISPFLPESELADFSQNELAKRSGVPRPTITNVESGEQVGLTLENARKLARALGITIDMLAGKGEESELQPALMP